MAMLIFKKQENPNTKKVTIFFYWTGCKGTPFQLKKEKGERLEYKTTAGRQIRAVQDENKGKAEGNTLKHLNACKML